MTNITYKKIKNSSGPSRWVRLGEMSAYESAVYGAYINNSLVAIIKRDDDGGYMEKASWIATDPHNEQKVFVYFSKTIKALKERLEKRDWS